MKKAYGYYSLSTIVATALTLALPLSAFASFNGVLPLTTSGSMPAPLAGPAITMSSYNLTEGQTATVTFTFPVAPLYFTASDISATNGTISNFASTTNPDVYTATFTPSTSTNAGTNAISVVGEVVGTTYRDLSFNGPSAVAFDGTNMWVASLIKIDKITPGGTITAYPGFDEASSIAFDGTNMWVANYGNSTVNKVALNGTILSTTTVATEPDSIAFDGTNMWVSSYIDGVSPGVVTEIASTSAVLLTATTTPGPEGIAFDGTNMWTANLGENGTSTSVTKISPTGSTTNYTGTDYGPNAIAFDGTNMWTANYGSYNVASGTYANNSKSVSKITSSGSITTYKGTGDAPIAIAFDGTNMWVANLGLPDEKGAVTEVAPNGSMVTYTGVGYTPSAIAFDGTSMWTANETNDINHLGDSVTKITGVISPSSSTNYVVDTIPPSEVGVSGTGSVTSQVQYLVNTGNTSAAQALQAQWSNLFPSVTTTSTPSTTTIPRTVPSIAKATSSPPAVSALFTRYLERGMKGSDVVALQQYLNAHGFTIAASGSGSPGHETEYFGILTFNALVKFQEAHKAEILLPFNLTTGTGVLGPSTIAFIASQ